MQKTLFQLEQEILTYKLQLDSACAQLYAKDQRIAELKAHAQAAADRQAQLERDAERYRYLRDAETLNQVIWDALEGIGSDEPEGYRRGFDKAVDDAIAAAKQTEKPHG